MGSFRKRTEAALENSFEVLIGEMRRAEELKLQDGSSLDGKSKKAQVLKAFQRALRMVDLPLVPAWIENMITDAMATAFVNVVCAVFKRSKVPIRAIVPKPMKEFNPDAAT